MAETATTKHEDALDQDGATDELRTSVAPNVESVPTSGRGNFSWECAFKQVRPGELYCKKVPPCFTSLKSEPA